jgi:hypothetical protein
MRFNDHCISGIPFYKPGTHSSGLSNLGKSFFQTNQLTKSYINVVVLSSLECDLERRVQTRWNGSVQ